MKRIIVLVSVASVAFCCICFLVASADSNVVSNGDFETGDVSGWLTSGDAAVVKDTLDPSTNGSLHSVAQGTYSVKIGDEIPWAQGGPQTSSISQEVLVPALSSGEKKVVIQFSYAVVANDPPSHAESDKPFFRVTVRDLTTNEDLYNTDNVYTSQTSGKWYLGMDPSGGASQRSFSMLSGDRWVFKPWENVSLDLGDRIGHRVHVEFVVRDCNPTAHAAYGYLDSIRVGDPVKIDLPPLEGNPVSAPYIGPNPVSQTLGLIEQLKLWPACLCLVPLLLLALVALLLGRRKGRPTASYAPLPSPDQPVEQLPAKTHGGLRPEEEKRKDSGRGGFRPGA